MLQAIDTFAFGLPPERLQRIKSVFRQFSNVEEVIIFGSRAIGTSSSSSDLDFAIKGIDFTYRDLLHLHELPTICHMDIRMTYCDSKQFVIGLCWIKLMNLARFFTADDVTILTT